jgi:AraC family transcriptional activator of pobA
MKKALPVYNIKHFKEAISGNDFYANYFVPHVKEHHIATTPHKHDFYLIVLFTAGKGKHEIDFTEYPIKPGTVFLMSPGQIHNWTFSEDIDGYVFFHSQPFYDEGFIKQSIRDYPFFHSIHNQPAVQLTKKSQPAVEALFKEIVVEYQMNELLKFEKLHALITLVYIELSRQYKTTAKPGNENYLDKVRKLEALIDKHFREKKYPYQYAELMNMTEKHLNRISKSSLDKTTSELISERIILEAKRILIHSKLPVSEAAFALGYEDTSYFSRFFKKNTGQTPVEFMKHYQ